MPNKNKLSSERIKGVKNGLIYYLIGIIITITFHYIIGWDNLHSPPTSFFVLIIVWLGGIIRALCNLINIDKKNRITTNKYELIIHSIPILTGIVLVFIIMFFNSN